MRTPTFVLAFSVLFFSLFPFFDSVHAQQEVEKSPVTFKVDILGHAEIRKGGLKDSSRYDPRFMVSRERLLTDYTGKTGNLRWDLHLTLQHTTIWGQTGSLQVYEGWGKLSNLWGAFVQVGRQALSYDDERIIGMNDWAMASLSHDILRTGFEHGAHKLHIAAAYNQDGDVDITGLSYYSSGAAQCYKTMFFGWYHLEPQNSPASLSLLFMNTGMQAGSKGANEHTEYQQLYGGYAKFDKPWLTLEGAYYYQGGKNENGIPIKAWMGAAKVSWNPLKKLGFTAGYDYLSGDKDFDVPPVNDVGLVQRKEINGFNSIWGSHHKFYGAMDFFYVSDYYGGLTPGLQNLYATIELHPLKDFDISLGYHYLSIATEHSNLDLTLGHELELGASYSITEEVSLSAGFSLMTGSNTMERLKRTPDDNNLRWAWIDFRFKN